MQQNELEDLIIRNLLASGVNGAWRMEDISALLDSQEQHLSKRNLERRLAEIQWLACSGPKNGMVDEFNRPAIQLVLDALVARARKKRKATLFIELNSLQTENSHKLKVIVAEDGKGAKRWCQLLDTTPSSLQKALETISDSKPTVFFPSGALVAACREIDQRETSSNLAVITACFPETSTPKHCFVQKAEPRIQQMTKHQPAKLSHLDRLEAESLHIIREVMAHAENPVMLYSVGKDSTVMLHLARKAFYPSPPPFPLMHVDTRWKFQAMYDFRDAMAKESNMELIIHINPEGVEKNINPFDHGSALHTDIMKTQGLKQALDLHQFDVAFGGARRDEEKSRAKERIFSFRSSSHRWDPKNQRPELWNLYNCRKAPGESVRVFPLSNWTELDIWQYIYRENIPIVPLYFAAERPVVERNGMLIMVDDDRIKLLPQEKIELKEVRFRTLGCYPLTGAVESSAKNLSQIVLELLQSRTSERQGRAIDSDGGSSMEQKKQEGYF